MVYKTNLGEKIKIGEAIVLSYVVEKSRSFSMADITSKLSGFSPMVIKKSKAMKEHFPHTKYEDLMNYISKSDANMSVEELIKGFNSKKR